MKKYITINGNSVEVVKELGNKIVGIVSPVGIKGPCGYSEEADTDEIFEELDMQSDYISSAVFNY